MRITTYSKKSVTVEGSEEEMLALQKMVAGLGYVACGREGMPLFAEKFLNVEPLPDPQLMQHFTPAPSGVPKFAREKQAPDLKFDEADDLCCSIYVEHICGYDYSVENYSRAASTLSSMGFSCMRSPRGKEGRYWEAWFLPGLWAGQGPLKGRKTVADALNTLIRYVSPGSISAVRQRMALTID